MLIHTRRITKSVVIKRVFRSQNVFNALGSAPEPVGGAYSVLPDPLAELRGKGEGKRGGTKERERIREKGKWGRTERGEGE